MSKEFHELGISQHILRALGEMGFQQPTEVQAEAIPHVFENKDLIVRSKTGSGKTAVFGVSMLDMLDSQESGPQALVLTPTRELAVQVDSDLAQMSKYLPHQTTAVYGQHSMDMEMAALKKKPAIVTGTPGRVYDHIRRKNLAVGKIRFLVIDEADRMLDMGFIDEVASIIKTLPKKRITLLFSATMPDEVHRIAQEYMVRPEMVAFESDTKTVDTVEQFYYRVEPHEKRYQLNRVLKAEQPASCIVFCNTKHAVDRVSRFLSQKGYAAQALHGDISQNKRMKTINDFKAGGTRILVATDVAARGIHIDELSLVVNYDVPVERDSYVHRIGRTGRTGLDGRAISLVTGEDIMGLYEIEEHIGVLIAEKPLPAESANRSSSKSTGRSRKGNDRSPKGNGRSRPQRTAQTATNGRLKTESQMREEKNRSASGKKTALEREGARKVFVSSTQDGSAHVRQSSPEHQVIDKTGPVSLWHRIRQRLFHASRGFASKR